MSRDSKYIHPHWALEDSLFSVSTVQVEALLEFDEPGAAGKRTVLPGATVGFDGGAKHGAGRRHVGVTMIAAPARPGVNLGQPHIPSVADDVLFEGVWRELGLPQSLE